MKLDRNINLPDGSRRGKYALVKMRELTKLEAVNNYSATSAVESLHMRGIVDYGDTIDTDFFVIRLKDRFAAPALRAYRNAVFEEAERIRTDTTLGVEDRDCKARELREYAMEICGLMELAETHTERRIPD